MEERNFLHTCVVNGRPTAIAGDATLSRTKSAALSVATAAPVSGDYLGERLDERLGGVSGGRAARGHAETCRSVQISRPTRGVAREHVRRPPRPRWHDLRRCSFARVLERNRCETRRSCELIAWFIWSSLAMGPVSLVHLQSLSFSLHFPTFYLSNRFV